MLIVLLAGCNFYSKEEAIMHNAPAKVNEHNNVEGNVSSNLAAIVAENFLESLTKGTDFKVSYTNFPCDRQCIYDIHP